MTLKIEITVPEDEVRKGAASRYVGTALEAIGYAKASAFDPQTAFKKVGTELFEQLSAERGQPVDESGCSAGFGIGDILRDGLKELEETAPETDSPVEVLSAQLRLRGKAGEGRARRTKVEMAEDEVLEQAAAAAGVAIEKIDARLAEGHSREKVLSELSVMATGKAVTITGQTDVTADEVPLISTGENRVGPEDSASDSEADQDAADEAAEAAGTEGPTHADLAAAVGCYQKKFGIEAAIADTTIILGSAIVDVPEAGLAEAIAKVDAVITTGKRPGAETSEPAVEPATKGEVGAALMEYMRKFDGPDTDPADKSTYPITDEDGQRVFKMIFGEGVTKLSEVPNDPIAYGRALAGVRELLAKNPYKREVRS